MIILSNTQPHGGGSSSIHPKRMDVRAISFGHQGSAVMREAAQLEGIDGNVSTIFKKRVNALHSHILLYHRHSCSSINTSHSHIFLLLLSFQSIKMVSSFM